MKKIYINTIEDGVKKKELMPVYAIHEGRRCSVFEETILVSGEPKHKLINFEIPSIIKPNYLEADEDITSRISNREYSETIVSRGTL